MREGRAPSPALLAIVATAGLALAVAAELYSLDEFGTARAVVDFIAGLAFMAAGLVAWVRRPGYHIGPLLTLAGFAWFIPGNLQTTTTDAPLYTLGLIGSVFTALLIHILVTFPSGRIGGRADRALVIAAYAMAPGLSTIAFLFFDPREHECPECEPGLNLIELRSEPGVYDRLSLTIGVVGLALISSVIVRLARRYRAAPRAGRRVLRPVLWFGCASVAVLFAGVFLAGVHSHGDDASDRVQGFARDAAVGLLPIGLLIGVLRTRAGRSPISRLLTELNEASGRRDLRAVLAEALGDRSLELGLWVPALERYVDPAGREVAPVESVERCATTVDGPAGPLAILVHDRVLLEDEDLVRGVTDGARLALERERLQAEVRAQLEEVRASRARIVEAGDTERRRIERDLHDGAQQRLLALTFGLRMLEERLDGAEASELRPLLDDLQREASATLDELRELARGIHPQVLTDEGLGAALEVLAARVPVAVSIRSLPAERLAPQVEAAAYYVCAEAIANVVKHAEATVATIEARCDGSVLHVEVSDDGRGGADPGGGTGLRGLADRVEALDGSLEVQEAARGGTVVRARIPTAAGVGM